MRLLRRSCGSRATRPRPSRRRCRYGEAWEQPIGGSGPRQCRCTRLGSPRSKKRGRRSCDGGPSLGRKRPGWAYEGGRALFRERECRIAPHTVQAFSARLRQIIGQNRNATTCLQLVQRKGFLVQLADGAAVENTSQLLLRCTMATEPHGLCRLMAAAASGIRAGEATDGIFPTGMQQPSLPGKHLLLTCPAL